MTVEYSRYLCDPIQFGLYANGIRWGKRKLRFLCLTGSDGHVNENSLVLRQVPFLDMGRKKNGALAAYYRCPCLFYCIPGSFRKYFSFQVPLPILFLQQHHKPTLSQQNDHFPSGVWITLWSFLPFRSGAPGARHLFPGIWVMTLPKNFHEPGLVFSGVTSLTDSCLQCQRWPGSLRQSK